MTVVFAKLTPTFGFEILCTTCQKLIWETGVQIDAEAIFFARDDFLMGYCEDCRPRGFSGTNFVNSVINQVFEDEIRILEVMMT
jgi:hypothetical protein